MSRSRQRPVRATTPGDPIWESHETHPAYGMIGASRVSSSPGETLAGSDFRHQHYINVRIHTASLRRGISNDYWGADREVIEVALSEAQWATFVSSLNVGNGVPCTIQFREGEGYVPGIVAYQDRTDQFRDELRDRMKKATEGLQDIIARTKNRADREALERVLRGMTDGAPWVVKMFDEHAETTTERMKAEASAYILSAIQRAGLAALGADSPITLEAGDD